MAAGSGMSLSGVGLITLALAACFQPAFCQDLGLGPGGCLLDRIEIIPCTRFSRTSVPGSNQVGIYRTVFRRGGSAGLPTCRIRGRDEIIRDIDVVGISNPVYTLFSPTLTDEATYGDQQYVEFNIQCGEGRLAFFNITDIDMQPKTCANPNLNNELQCVDYVRVNRGGFGFTESCGMDSSENREQLESTPLQVIFRTSLNQRFRGFNGTVICFDPALRDQPGCTRPTNSSDDMPTASPGQRKKRDLEMFHMQWQRRAAYIRRMRRQAGIGGGKVMFRFIEIDVPFGQNVTFSNGKLDFINTIDGSVINTIEDVLILQTFDANGDIDAFKREALNEDGVVIPLPGPGPLIVVGRHAYFQLFVIDPRGLVPNAEEMVVISNLSDEQLQLTAEDESDRLNIINPTEPDVNDLFFGRRRRRRQAGQMLSFADQTVLLALQNENACNPVLRASANSVIESTDPARVMKLRNMLTTNAPTSSAPTVPATTPPIPQK